MPTKFSTALVKNPSGGKVVQTLESCEMKEKCYRVSQVEYYYEIVHSSTGHREKRLKVGPCSLVSPAMDSALRGLNNPRLLCHGQLLPGMLSKTWP